MQPSYRIRISKDAHSDLDGIFQHISLESLQNAAAMKERILDAVDRLYLMPSRFKVVGMSRKSGAPVHARVVRPYIIYYRVDERQQTVYVFSIRHGARRPPRGFP